MTWDKQRKGLYRTRICYLIDFLVTIRIKSVGSITLDDVEEYMFRIRFLEMERQLFWGKRSDDEPE